MRSLNASPKVLSLYKKQAGSKPVTLFYTHEP